MDFNCSPDQLPALTRADWPLLRSIRADFNTLRPPFAVQSGSVSVYVRVAVGVPMLKAVVPSRWKPEPPPTSAHSKWF